MTSEAKNESNFANFFEVLKLISDGEEEDSGAVVSSKEEAKMKTTATATATVTAVEEGKSKKNASPRGSQKGAEADDLSARPRHDFVRPLVWIDLEMTGLEVQSDRILEIACVITDGHLERSVDGPSLVIHQSEEVLGQMNDWSKEHHTASGLTERVRQSSVSEQEAEKQVFDFVSQYVEPGKGTVAGNSVYKDLAFIQEYMPNLAMLFSHVLVDVSSVRSLCVRWFPQDAKSAPEKKKNHRALEDIRESIAELRYMRGAIFKKTSRR